MARARRRLGRRLVTTAAVLVLCACATTSTLRLAKHAESGENFDVAVAEYLKALHEHPGDPAIQAALDRTRLLAAERHAIRGRQLLGAGRYDDAVVELQLASELSPGDSEIARDLKAARLALRNKLAVDQHGKTALEAIITRAREIPATAPGLPDVTLPAAISMGQQATSRSAYRLLAELGNLNIAFDQTFIDAPAALKFTANMKLRDALDAVARATNTFYRVTAQSTIIVVPNTPVKQREYQEEWTQTFPIENADVAETIDLLKTALDVRFVSKMSATNLISVRDTPERLQAVGRLLQAMDKARPEVVVDVEILEVDRTKLQQYGLQVASPGSPGIAGTADPNSSTLTLHSLLNLTQSDVLMTGVPALYYNLLKTDTNTRILANPHMRASDGIAAEEKFGQRVPVPNATFAPIAAGGVNQQPITSYTYENVGVTIDITPRTHANDDVTLALKVVLSEQGAAGFGGLPTFGNREITTTIRLKDGETSILAGLVREDDTKQLDGLPGISDLPLIGRLFGNNSHTRAQTDVILTLTPHIVRVLDLSDSDLQPFRIQRDGSGGGGATIEGAPAPEVLPASPVPGTSGTGRGRGGRAPEIRSPKLELRSQK